MGDLCKNPHFIRAAGFMSGEFFHSFSLSSSPLSPLGSFALYAPKLCKDYEVNINALLDRYTGLKKPFHNSVFPTCTFNGGDRVVTLEHVDSTNVPYGLCAIFACGSYDPTKGGHLVLFNLCLIIEFPPGSTILVPSGTIRHGNIPIWPKETRHSFTQYCPGGLLRWVAYGFQPVKMASPSIKQAFQRTQEERRVRAVGLFSKASEVYDDRVAVFELKSYR